MGSSDGISGSCGSSGSSGCSAISGSKVSGGISGCIIISVIRHTPQASLGVSSAASDVLQRHALEGCHYSHPLAGRTSPVVVGGDYITTEAGTGEQGQR